MNVLNHYQIESTFGRFELRLEDDFLRRIDVAVEPKLFKQFCIALSGKIVNYEEEYGWIDTEGMPSSKTQMSSSYDRKDLTAIEFDFTSTEFHFALTIKSFISSEECVLKVDPVKAKMFVIDCANTLLQYEESQGTVEL